MLLVIVMAKKPTKKELVGAKVSPEVRAKIEKMARDEERTISQTVARLLASHPAITNTKATATA